MLSLTFALLAAQNAGPIEAAASTADVTFLASDTSAFASETIGFLPRGLTSFGAATSGGWLYVVGGYHGRPHDYSIEGQSRAFLQINLEDPRDVRMLPDVEPAQAIELRAWRDKLVRVGGMHARNVHGEPEFLESSSEVALFDPILREWTALPPLPRPRSSHRAIVIGDKLHVVGGWTLKGGSKSAEWASTFLTLDLAVEEPAWEEVGAPFERRALGVAATETTLFVVGGIQPDRSISNAVSMLDLASGEWTEGPEFPDFGFGVSAVAQGDTVLASGMSGTVHALRPGAETWEPAGEMAHGRIFHELLEDGDDVLALGGIVGMGTRGRVRAIERLTTKAPHSFVQHFRVPAPCATKNRFGFFVEGRSVHLFGGNRSLDQHAFDEEDFVAEGWRFDLGSLDWDGAAPLPAALQTFRTAMSPDGEMGYAVAGFGHDGDAATTMGQTWVYDFEFDDWTKGPALAGTRSQFMLARREQELWVFGGLEIAPRAARDARMGHPTTVLRWDGTADAFEVTEVKMPAARRAFAGGQYGDRVFMFGGLSENFAPLDGGVSYDFETGEWADLAGPSRTRIGGDLVTIGEYLYLFGGSSRNEDGELSSNRAIERFDPAAGTWSTVIGDVGMESRHARAFEVDGKLCVLSLHHDGEPFADVLFIDVEAAAAASREM